MRALAVVALLSACGAGTGATTPSASSTTAPARSCPTLTAPTAIAIAAPKPGELHELFDLADTPALWATAPEDEATAQYRAALVARLGSVEPGAVLKRQAGVFDAKRFPNEAKNIAVILGGVGTIASSTCLDRQLFERQAARFPPIEHPTEFGAFILRGGGRVRVYFSSMDMVGQKIRHEVTSRVEEDTKHGFRLVAHEHSHPFLFDRQIGDRMWTTAETINDVAGALAPSLADAALWNSASTELSMESGWITNGLDSIRVPSSSFGLFAKDDH